MDKTDKPKSVDEILDDLINQSFRIEENYKMEDTEKDYARIIAQAKQDIYSLLGEGVKDKYPKKYYLGFNSANAAWRKHLQERLK